MLKRRTPRMRRQGKPRFWIQQASHADAERLANFGRFPIIADGGGDQRRHRARVCWGHWRDPPIYSCGCGASATGNSTRDGPGIPPGRVATRKPRSVALSATRHTVGHPAEWQLQHREFHPVPATQRPRLVALSATRHTEGHPADRQRQWFNNAYLRTGAQGRTELLNGPCPQISHQPAGGSASLSGAETNCSTSLHVILLPPETRRRSRPSGEWQRMAKEASGRKRSGHAHKPQREAGVPALLPPARFQAE